MGLGSHHCLRLFTRIRTRPSPFRSEKHSCVSPFSLFFFSGRRLQRSRRNGCCHGNSRCKNSFGLSLGNPSWSCRAIGSSGGTRGARGGCGGTEPGPVPGFKSPFWAGMLQGRLLLRATPARSIGLAPAPGTVRMKPGQKQEGGTTAPISQTCSSAGEGLSEGRAAPRWTASARPACLPPCPSALYSLGQCRSLTKKP